MISILTLVPYKYCSNFKHTALFLLYLSLLLSAAAACGQEQEQKSEREMKLELWEKLDPAVRKVFGEFKSFAYFTMENELLYGEPWGTMHGTVPITPKLMWEAKRTESANYAFPSGHLLLPAAEQQMVAAYNGFCMRLFQEMLQTEQGNVMLSPTQLASMLCGVGKAVPESVGRQIAQCFGTESLDSVQPLLSQVQDIIDRTDTFALLPHRSVLLANKRVFAKNELPTSFPKGTVVPTNFSKPKHLQSLCGSDTESAALDSLLRANPAAPAYLLGQAKLEAKAPNGVSYDFQGVGVLPDTFFMPDGTPLLAPMRREKAMLLYTETDHFFQVLYPYGRSGSMALAFIVPKQGVSFEQLATAFVADSMVQRCQREHFVQSRCYMKIPCFRYGKTLSLKSVLTAVGLGALFSNPALRLEDLCQQVQFEHTLAGSFPKNAPYHIPNPDEEASNGGLILDARVPRIYLVANRPFIYYVFDQETGLLHLIGAYRGE